MPNRLAKVVSRGGAKKQKPVPVKIVHDRGEIAPSSMDRKWEARNAIDTLRRAEEIKRDKGLMKAVKAEAKAQVKALSTVCK